MRPENPKAAIDDGPMRPWQWVAITMTVGLNALDGIDVLSVSYAAPGIAREWNVPPATLGWVLSMELLGMALGSIALGGIADKIGRRTTILGCLIVMALGMLAAGRSSGVTELLSWRLFTGLGIGGMLPAINASAAEFANHRWRNLAMSMMVIGYPLGGAFGGIVVRMLLNWGADWRSIFELGALATTLFIPLVWFFVPETPAFLDRRQPPGALERANRSLAQLGHAPVDQLSRATDRAKTSILDIFRPGLMATTLLITAAYFAHITSFYFIIKWTPKVVVNLGFLPAAAAGVLAWANLGGAVGGATFGILATRFSLKLITTATLIGSSGLIFWFGFGQHELNTLNLQIFATGFSANAAIAGLYLLFAKVFPTHVRATGTGFAIGAGRGGAAMAPVLAGYLFQSGYGLPLVAACMGSGSLVAAIALQFLREKRAD